VWNHVVPDDGLRIGELATLAGVTPRTLRHYEQLGLISPPRRGENGYRRYGTGSLLEVAEVRRLRSLGLGIDEIAKIRRDQPPTGEVLEAGLDRLDADLAARIADLSARRVALRAVRDGAARGEPLLAQPMPADFGNVRVALAGVGASERAIDEEARVWAALDGLDLPPAWRATIRDGLAALEREPSTFTRLAEVLEVIADLRDVDGEDDARIEAAGARLAQLATTMRADDAVSLANDAVAPAILHVVASCFTPAQHRAIASMMSAMITTGAATP
jgi:DNA-binding transcriptional MerR regulator